MPTVTTRPLADLKADAENPRTIDAESLAGLLGTHGYTDLLRAKARTTPALGGAQDDSHEPRGDCLRA